MVTGHSLGAAMATLMAARHPQAELVTFGSPRVGDEAFAAQFEDRDVRRYVDCNDVVTMVPPGLIGYVHAGEMHYIDRFGIVHPKPPDASAIAEDRQIGRRDYRRRYAWQFWRNVADPPAGRPHADQLRLRRAGPARSRTYDAIAIRWRLGFSLGDAQAPRRAADLLPRLGGARLRRRDHGQHLGSASSSRPASRSC